MRKLAIQMSLEDQKHQQETQRTHRNLIKNNHDEEELKRRLDEDDKNNFFRKLSRAFKVSTDQ